MRFANHKKFKNGQTMKSINESKKSENGQTNKFTINSSGDSLVSRKEIQNFINHLGLDQHQPKIKHPKDKDNFVNSNKEDRSKNLTKNADFPEKLTDTNVNNKHKKSRNKFKNPSDQTLKSVKSQVLDSQKTTGVSTKSDNWRRGPIKKDNFVNNKEESNVYQKYTQNLFKKQYDQPLPMTIKPQILGYKKRTYLLAKPSNQWYAHMTINGNANGDLPPQLVSEMENLAATLFQDEVEVYIKKFQQQRLSDFQWIRTVIAKGTLVDKMAALTIMIQDSPLHNLSSIDTLLNMAKKKERRENVIAMTTLKDLFTTDLLPSDRKLKTFIQHPLNELTELTSGNKDHRDKCLIYWHFEHQLKERYHNFLKALEAISFDTVESSKSKALSSIFWLLSNKPEQEQVLLAMLVNKLGDPVNKIASKAANFLVMLVMKHPSMKFVVALEVERLLYRPNISPRAQYYAVCFLNQLILDPEDDDLAARLITIYLSFFKILIKKKEVDSKMLSALLTGVNRAYPFTKGKSETIIDEIPTLLKIVHTMTFTVAVQTLMLLYQLLDVAENIMDRFYTALYRKIWDPDLLNCSRQTLFLNLLYKSLKKDPISRRNKAFLKRLLQACNYHQPPFVCGVLILLSELIRIKPRLLDVILPEDSDDDEHFVDLKGPDSDIESEQVIQEEKVNSKESHNSVNTITSWFHRKNLPGKQTNFHHHYDPFQRNPLYCGAEYSIFWELHNLSNHYHPSVALFAQKILKGIHIVYTGDPLEDFTSMHFLERFVYRNPKKVPKQEKPNASVHAKKVLLAFKSQQVPVYSNEFISRKESNISPDEIFLYKYLKEKKSKITDNNSDESDTESIPDAEFDLLLDKLENDKKSAQSQLGLDFASEFRKHIDENKKKGNIESGSEDDEEDDDVNFDDDEEFKAAFKGFDLSKNNNDEDAEYDDGEDPEYEDFDDEAMELDEELHQSSKQSANKTNIKKTKKEKIKLDLDLDEEDFDFGDDEFSNSKKFPQKQKRDSRSGNRNLFAAAEKFSLLLEGDDGNYDTSGINAFSNKDNAKIKQLKWEQERDRWVRGVDWKSRKRMKSRKSRKPFVKKNTKYNKK